MLGAMKRTAIAWPSALLVAGQMGSILALLLAGPVIPSGPVSAGLFGGGLCLAGWAVLAVGPRRVKVGPDPGERTRLVTTGPYRWVRHPMYAATLVITSAWLVEGCSWIRGAVWLVLVAVLWTKAAREERLLRAMFPGYVDYAKRTRRFIPFVC